MKKIIVLFAVLVSFRSYAQKTGTRVEGVSVFKIGDTITRMAEYGYEFVEVFVADDFDYSERYLMLDSGRNFCDHSKVFVCEKVVIDEFEFEEGATLTYFNNRLVDIRLKQILSLDSKLADLLKLKYGHTYGKIILDGYEIALQKYRSRGIVITPELTQRVKNLYLSSIFWTNQNITLSVGGSNKTYDFFEKRFKPAQLAEGGLSVTDNIQYQKLITCSNADHQRKLKAHLKRLSEKTDKF